MDHPNGQILRAQLDALARGDLPTAMSFYTDDVVFHYPGADPLSGDHRGKAAVVELLGRVFQMTGGRFRPQVHGVLASDGHVAALVTVHAERDDRKVDWKSIDLFHVRDGKLTEHWVYELDQEAVDAFWS